MKTTQAWAWLTAGVLALGLNGIYRDCVAPWAHQFVEQASLRAASGLEPVSTHVDELLARAQNVAARSESRNCRISSGVAQLQRFAAQSHSGVSRMEAMSARQQAQCARLEAARARIEAQVARAQFATMDLEPMEVNVPEIHVTCPRVRVIAPLVARPVHIEMPGSGPI